MKMEFKDTFDIWVVEDRTSHTCEPIYHWDSTFDTYDHRRKMGHQAAIWQVYTVGDENTLRATVLGGTDLEMAGQDDCLLSDLLMTGEM